VSTMFQKRHYEKMAHALRESSFKFSNKDMVALFLCRVFAEDNPLFDSDRFLSACGIIGGDK